MAAFAKRRRISRSRSPVSNEDECVIQVWDLPDNWSAVELMELCQSLGSVRALAEARAGEFRVAYATDDMTKMAYAALRFEPTVRSKLLTGGCEHATKVGEQATKVASAQQGKMQIPASEKPKKSIGRLLRDSAEGTLRAMFVELGTPISLIDQQAIPCFVAWIRGQTETHTGKNRSLVWGDVARILADALVLELEKVRTPETQFQDVALYKCAFCVMDLFCVQCGSDKVCMAALRGFFVVPVLMVSSHFKPQTVQASRDRLLSLVARGSLHTLIGEEELLRLLSGGKPDRMAPVKLRRPPAVEPVVVPLSPEAVEPVVVPLSPECCEIEDSSESSTEIQDVKVDNVDGDQTLDSKSWMPSRQEENQHGAAVLGRAQPAADSSEDDESADEDGAENSEEILDVSASPSDRVKELLKAMGHGEIIEEVAPAPPSSDDGSEQEGDAASSDDEKSHGIFAPLASFSTADLESLRA